MKTHTQSRGWLAEALRDVSRQSAAAYDQSIWSYRHRPASRVKRLRTLTARKERADLLYAWATGNVNLKGD